VIGDDTVESDLISFTTAKDVDGARNVNIRSEIKNNIVRWWHFVEIFMGIII
jgi:hypothetical protein